MYYAHKLSELARFVYYYYYTHATARDVHTLTQVRTRTFICVIIIIAPFFQNDHTPLRWRHVYDFFFTFVQQYKM